VSRPEILAELFFSSVLLSIVSGKDQEGQSLGIISQPNSYYGSEGLVMLRIWAEINHQFARFSGKATVGSNLGGFWQNGVLYPVLAEVKVAMYSAEKTS